MSELLSSNVSKRRVALLLRANRKTILRKFLFESARAKRERLEWLGGGTSVPEEGRLELIHFDEMETFERSKCLPLSVALAVDPKTRRILAAKVASMPAKGLLAAVSVYRYGPRADDRPEAADSLFREIAPRLRKDITVISDLNPKYPGWIHKNIPGARHETVKGRRGCVVGQGELKRGGFDPLFALNHTAAMIRANVNRLARRTWCTTKRRDRLEAHLELYIRFHNSSLIP